jgi:hypothetical protein
VRIPFPERVRINRVALFAAFLFAVQQAEGTALYFSLGCVAFLLIAAVAFNIGGGLTRTQGTYVFFYSILVVIVGICYKALIGEPAQSNLADLVTDIEVYVGGISAMLVAVVISRRFSPSTGLLQNTLKSSDAYRASVGCMVFGTLGGFVIALLGAGAAALNSAFTQLNQLIPLGIIIGVAYEIRRSGGTRSLNLPIIIFGAYCFGFYGLLGFSKQGMLLPITCWALPVCAMRFRLSTKQIAGCLLGTFILFYYMVPYSQYGRRFVLPGQSISDKIDIAVRLLSSPEQTRKEYAEVIGVSIHGYYNKPEGFWDRLQFISVDDGLVNVTDQGKVFGLLPIEATLMNAIPHFLWPGKPSYLFGNIYAHEIGRMSEEDTTTGISFSPTAEAYHLMKWVGIFVVAPVVWLSFFLLYDKLFGDLRASPWGLLVIAMLSHSAPEGMLTSLIAIMTFGTEALLFCAFFASRIAPYFSVVVLGPGKRIQPAFPVRRVATPR